MIFESRKGQTSRPMMIFSIMLFYLGLGVFYSAYGSSVTDFGDYAPLTSSTGNFSDFYEGEEGDPESKLGIVNFFKSLKVGFNETPWWLNVLLFIPLGVLMIYLIIVAWINPS